MLPQPALKHFTNSDPCSLRKRIFLVRDRQPVWCSLLVLVHDVQQVHLGILIPRCSWKALLLPVSSLPNWEGLDMIELLT